MYGHNKARDFGVLLGQTLVKVEGADVQSDRITFETKENGHYRQHHPQD